MTFQQALQKHFGAAATPDANDVAALQNKWRGEAANRGGSDSPFSATHKLSKFAGSAAS